MLKVHYTSLFTTEALNEALANKLVSVRKHPVHPIYIYNYTASAMFGWEWNDVTLKCRGLVLDEEGYVVARSLPKFFSYEQLEGSKDLTLRLNESVEVMDKVDGSLGIVFKYKDELVVATRGSFDSEQALKAREIVCNKYVHLIKNGFTYLVEIIYPENRVVLSYGSLSDLILLSVIDIITGEVKLDEYTKVSEERNYLPNIFP